MKKLVIGVDVDDTIGDMVPVWRDIWVMRGGNYFDVNQIRDWSFTGIFKTPEDRKCFYGLLESHAEEIFQLIQPYPGALEAIKELRDIGRVIFITSCSKGMTEPKWDWMVRHGFLEDTRESRMDFFPVTDKALVRADVLVDDSMANIMAFPGHGLLIDQPHNREPLQKQLFGGKRMRLRSIREAPTAIRWLAQQ